MPQRLTKRNIEKLETTSTGGTMFYDSEIPGFLVMVYPSGRKVFKLRYGDRRRRRIVTIGLHGPLTVEQARSKAKALLGKVAEGEDPASDALISRQEFTFREWKAQYIERAQGRKKTWKRDVQYLALAEQLFGLKPLSEVTTRDCDVFFERTRGERGDTSANRALASLKACFSSAWRLGLVEANPALRVKPMREPPPRTRFFSEDEWRALLLAVTGLEDPYAKGGLALLFSTGCRLSEALGLKWEDIDWEGGIMRLPLPKSGKPQSIPLPGSVFEFIGKLPRMGLYVVAGKNPNKPRADLKRAWAKVCNEAKVEGHIHDIRRTVATRLARHHGLNVVRLALRHSNANVTLRHYVQEEQEQIRGALESLERDSNFSNVLQTPPEALQPKK